MSHLLTRAREAATGLLHAAGRRYRIHARDAALVIVGVAGTFLATEGANAESGSLAAVAVLAMVTLLGASRALLARLGARDGLLDEAYWVLPRRRVLLRTLGPSRRWQVWTFAVPTEDRIEWETVVERIGRGGKYRLRLHVRIEQSAEEAIQAHLDVCRREQLREVALDGLARGRRLLDRVEQEVSGDEQ